LKSINETFEDEDFERIKRAKGDLSWHDFLLKCAEMKVKA
jgi:hypothetical protein